MKKTVSLVAIALLGVMSLASCNNSGSVELPGFTKAEIAAAMKSDSTRFPKITKSDVDSVSYAVGVSFGGMLKSSDLECVNLGMVKKGITDYFASTEGGKPVKIKEREVSNIIQNFIRKMQEATGIMKKAQEKKFLEKNKQNDSVCETASGLQYKIERKGNGIKPGPKDTVEVNYVGKLLNGKVFDSSYERKKSVTFPLNRVIKGWGEGLQLCDEGGKIHLWIPFDLGYGSRPFGADLPAFSTLDFDVELIKVKPAIEKPAKVASKIKRPVRSKARK